MDFAIFVRLTGNLTDMDEKNRFDVCCSEQFHGMAYPHFSIVFIQTFSINHFLEFKLPVSMMKTEDVKDDSYPKTADDYEAPIVLMNRGMEDEIFVLPDNDFVRKPFMGRCSFSPNNIYRFTMRGFDFRMPIVPKSDKDNFEHVVLEGHAYVEAALFFSHTVSLTYRFCFDGEKAKVLDVEGKPVSAVTDHIISFLSTHLSAEYWSQKESSDSASDNSAHSAKSSGTKTTIAKHTSFFIKNFRFDEDGRYLTEPVDLDLTGDGRSFDTVALRYKKYIYSHCRYRNIFPLRDLAEHVLYRWRNPMTVDNDNHYAMVDIWEDVTHPTGMDDDPDYFSETRKDKLSEKAIISHIYDWHKPELIGLMTLYPGEWVYRDSEAYDEVCGEDIAIDNDDLVLAGSNVSLVIGTYGRRGNKKKKSKGQDATKVDWVEHLEDIRKVYHVSWPEYLVILQMVLAKKHVVGIAKEQMVKVTLSTQSMSSSELIKENSELGMRLSRMIMQLDLLKYSKFASHKVMFDRTTERLNLNNDVKELKDISEMIDSSLHNLSDYKSVQSDYLLNIVLSIISVISALSLLFQEPSLPFMDTSRLRFLKDMGTQDHIIANWIVTVIAAIVIFAILIVFFWAFRKLVRWILKR